MLSGVPRQGRIGLGYASLFGNELSPCRREPELVVDDLDRALSEIASTIGTGSVTARRELLESLFARATQDECDFIRRLLTGELRQGALTGIMVDAVAKAAAVPVDLTRRALMLSGDLPRTATIALTEGEDGLRNVGFELF